MVYLKQKLENVFKLYYQINTKDQAQGSGIGLYLVKELVSLLDGEITLSSSVDIGTLFTIKLPVTHNAQIQKFEDTEELWLSLPGAAPQPV